ncbi:MAG: hypothetical protein JXM70_02765 [Pirellulales bacterium]|nr:hypothetical protein [Pirellulales bacterium]
MTGTRTQFASLIAAAMVLLAGVGGCASYQIGNQSLYPSHIKTVHVPVFDSLSFRRNLGEQLSEAVIKEIETKTPYKVVGSASEADSVLTCKIIQDQKNMIVQDWYNDPRQMQIAFRIQVSWVDRKGDVLRQSQPIVISPATSTSVTASSILTPEVGQSVATAQQLAIQRAAEQIVGMMETPW